MGLFENYMVFIICAIATITLATCKDGDDTSRTRDDDDYVPDFRQLYIDTHLLNKSPEYYYTDATEHKQFYDEILALHNKARAKHGAAPLVLNDKAFTYVMIYLDRLSSGEIDLTHMPWYYNPYVPEKNEQVTAKTIFDSWYGEGEGYNYNREPENTNTAHFTQIVWKSTRIVGFGFMYRNNKCYFAALYVPYGNRRGEYVSNVKKPKSFQNLARYIPCLK